MEENTIERDIESAYGSDVTSNFTLLVKKDNFKTEEKNMSKKEVWHQWIKYRIRHYMILEVLFCIILVLILSNSYHISSQNEKTYEMILKLQSQVNSLEKRIDSNRDFNRHDFDNPVRNEKPTKGKLINVETKPIEKDETIVKDEPTQPQKPITIGETIPKPVSFVSPKQQEQFITIENFSLPQFNAASYVDGAFVLRGLSSSSNLASIFDRDQSGYVLFERDELLPKQAWCSEEKQPFLTVNLSRTIQPTVISYQHSKWNGTIPDGAPKIYDLVGCLDHQCKETVQIVSNCEYKSSGNNQEQNCTIPSFFNRPPVRIVQFRFRENHGNANKTCVNFVRVYGVMNIPKAPKKKRNVIKDAETCSELKWYYHNIPFIYNNFMKKSCSLLHLKGCCTECLECCRDCEMKDINGNLILQWVFIIFICFIFICCPILRCIFE